MNNPMKGAIATAVLATGVALTYTAGAGDGQIVSEEDLLLVRRDSIEYRSMERYYPLRDEVIEIYTSKKDRISSFEVSPSHSSLALIETKERLRKDQNSGFSSVNSLAIIDGNGRTLWKSYDDVRKIAYRPDGRALAYLSGKYEETERGFKPDKIYVVSFPSGPKGKFRKREISSSSEPDDLRWTHEDDGFYLYLRENGLDLESRVVRYKNGQGQAKTTSLRSVNISGDGKYSILSASETINDGSCRPGVGDDNCIRIAELGIQKEVKRQFQLPNNEIPIRWLRSKSSQLVLKSKGNSDKVLRKSRSGKSVRINAPDSPRTYSIYSADKKEKIQTHKEVRIEESKAWQASKADLVIEKNHAPSSSPRMEIRRATPSTDREVLTKESLKIEIGSKLDLRTNTLLSSHAVEGRRSITTCQQICKKNEACDSFELKENKSSPVKNCRLYSLSGPKKAGEMTAILSREK